jgi:hypothetical protein
VAVDRALTGPEHIVAAAAADLAEKIPAVARPADDLLDHIRRHLHSTPPIQMSRQRVE